jgi:hypothetical protein
MTGPMPTPLPGGISILAETENPVNTILELYFAQYSLSVVF